MIKHNSKKDLIELTYKLSIERDGLIDCLNNQDIILKDVADLFYSGSKWYKKLWNIFTLPFRLNNKLKEHSQYFYIYKLNKMNNLIKLDEQQAIEALEHINKYEAKTLHPELYKDYIQSVTKVKLCNTCGSSLLRAHNDFQRFIFTKIKENYDYLLPKLTLTSGKYASEYNSNTIPFYTYHNLHLLISQMKKEVNNFAKRGYNDQANLVLTDHAAISDYIKVRMSYISEEPKSIEMESIVKVIKDIKVIEDNKPVVLQEAVLQEAVEEITVDSVSKAEGKSNTNKVPDNTDKVLEEQEVEPIESIEEQPIEEEQPSLAIKSKFILTPQRLQIASEMKADKIHLKAIAKQLNVNYKGLSAAIKEYEASKVTNSTTRKDKDGAIALF